MREEVPTVVRRDRPAIAGEERRAATRLPIEIDIDVEGAAQRFRTTTGDLSASGVFIVTHREIPLGTHVMLGLELPSGVALEVIGVVRWRRDGSDGGIAGLGVAFFCLEPESKKVLADFCGVREALYGGESGESGEIDESGEWAIDKDALEG